MHKNLFIVPLKNCAVKSLRVIVDLSQVQAVYSAASVLKVISHFAWNCAKYISGLWNRRKEQRGEDIAKEKYAKIVHKSRRILGSMIYR